MALQGIQGFPIDVEIDTQPGIPSFTIVGLGDTSIQESRERIRSAIKNSERGFPIRRVTINLAPAHIRKTGSAFDLAIALGLVLGEAKDGQMEERFRTTVILGELALDGKLRPLVGALPFVISAQNAGFSRVMVPWENYPEVARVSPIEILPVKDLSEAMRFFERGAVPNRPLSVNIREVPRPKVAFESIIGQDRAKRCLVIAASGGHNLLFEGPPGSGKSLLSCALQGILPEMNPSEALEVAQIYSVLGKNDHISHLERPFRHVHHTASTASIVGGGKFCHPGEISLAHRGVLFLDELLEFQRPVIESLREPMESREIRISRIHGTYAYPASFMLVGAMNPCPCGYLGDPQHVCKDTANEISKYRGKLSGPILDRIDLFVQVPRVPLGDLQCQERGKLTTSDAKRMVQDASSFAHERQGKQNAELLPRELESLAIESDASELLQNAIERLSLSLRAYHRLLRVSRTIADLERAKKIASAHVAEAMGYRQG